MQSAPGKRLEHTVLFLLCLYVLVFQCWCGISWHIGFDEGWHVFYADVEPLIKALREMGGDAHPPLSYLLMRPFVDLGSAPIWPRLCSILPAVPQPLLLFLILRRLGLTASVALTGAALFAFSHTFTAIGVAVRGYSLSMCFVLLSTISWLDLLPGGPMPKRRTLLAFVLFSSGAAGTEYPAIFFTLAMLGATLLVAAGSAPFRAELLVRLRAVHSWFPWLVFASAYALIVAYYALSFWGRGMHHVADRMLREDQSAFAYLVEGSLLNLSIFSPIPVEAGGWVLVVCVAALLGLGMLQRGTMVGRRRLVILITLVSMWLGIYALGLLGMYPFGGLPRHQHFLFPLLLCVALMGLDATIRGLGRPRLGYVLLGLVLATGIGTTSHSFQTTSRGEFPQEIPWVEERQALFCDETEGVPIFMTNFSFVGLYGPNRGLVWKFMDVMSESIDVFSVGPAGQWTVIRDRHQWSSPERADERMLATLQKICEAKQARRLLVFTARQESSPPADAEEQRRIEATLRSRFNARGFALNSLRIYSAGEIYEVECRE